MASKNQVIWNEGLFIQPQHFQQQARFFTHQLQQRIAAVSPYLYGFKLIELNQEYLSFGKIAIVRAKGIMPDGTVFDIPNDVPPPAPMTIEDVSAVNQIVYLTLPMQTDGMLEVRWPESHGNNRHTVQYQEIKDTMTEEGSYVNVALSTPNVGLALEQDDRSSFTCLALGKILDKRPDGSLVMDENFYPTSYSLEAVPPLKRFLGEVSGLMRERAKNIAKRIGTPDQSGVADITDFNLLLSLNRMHPYFQHLSRCNQVHPEELYIAFSQACGELTTFTDDSRLPEEYPSYQHERLRESFITLEETLRRILSTVMQPRAVSLPIIKQRYGMLTSPLQDRSLLQGADFILAVRARMPNEQLRQQFLQQAKIASLEEINKLVNLQLPGIPLISLPVAPRYLPYHSGFNYFELDRTSAHWQHMMKNTAGFGFHIAGQFPELELQFWAIRSQ